MAKGMLSLRFSQLACLSLGWIWAVQGLNCSINPFSLDYKSQIVITGPEQVSAHRSLLWKVGSAQTTLGMQLGTTLNSTFLPDAKVCTSTIDRACVAWRGGLFNTSSSDSWSKDIGATAYNGSVLNAGWDYLNEAGYEKSNEGPLTRFPHGWDTVRFGDLQIFGFPFTVIDDPLFPFGAGMMGLADASIFLNQSVSAGVSPSRSWAFDYGLTAQNVPGELVIGGYNPNKATYDTFTNFTVFPDKTRPCPLQINIKGFKWGSVDLMDGQPTFMACVEPAYWTTIMPLTVQRNFNKTMLQAQDIAFWRTTWEYFMYNSTNNNNTNFVGLPNGDFTIELDVPGGLNVTIPREEWIYPAVQPDYGTGGWDIVPGSIQTTMGTAGWADGVEPKLTFLGGPFLSQVYLVVDYETGIFSLAPINRGGTTGSQGLRTLGCDARVLPPAPQTPTSTPSSSDKKSNLGAIIGGSVGGAIVLIWIAGAIFFCRRRRHRRTPIESIIVPGPTKEQNEVEQMGFYQHPYDAPPAFSPTASPGPDSPSNSPGPYMASVPLRRPLPGHDQYPSAFPPGQTHGGYYDNQQPYGQVPSMVSEPAELKGTDVVSELSGSNPPHGSRTHSELYDQASGPLEQPHNR